MSNLKALPLSSFPSSISKLTPSTALTSPSGVKKGVTLPTIVRWLKRELGYLIG
jgi:hypothetical protein